MGDDMDDVVFTVPGEPQGKGRPRFARPKGSNFTMAYTPEKTVSYENRVKAMKIRLSTVRLRSKSETKKSNIPNTLSTKYRP